MAHFQITDWTEQEAKVTFMIISPLPQIQGGFWGTCSILLPISTLLASWQKMNLQNRQSVQAAQYQKNKQPTQKVGRRPKQTFLQRRLTNVSQTYEKMLNIKCKSKLQWGITSHQSKWPSSKSLQTINAGEGVEKREPFCNVGGNVNWYSHYGR